MLRTRPLVRRPAPCAALFDEPSGTPQPVNGQKLNAQKFEERWRQLLSGHTRQVTNHGCVECVGCRGCSGCTFCRDSERLVRAHYCVDCSLCSDCSHCRKSQGLIGCHHCIECEHCSASSYLVRCVAVTGSTYCFGCVGLGRADYHVLNEKYEREQYFAIVRQLSRELGL